MNITIIGAGKIGLAIGNLAESFCEVSYIDTKKTYSNDYSNIEKSDIVFIAVNTTTNDGYDTSNVDFCLDKIKDKNIKETVILSTCPPSYFQKKLNVIYSPLFIRQGSILQDIINAEFILIGSELKSCKLIEFYSNIRSDYKFIHLSQMEAAIVKISINGFLCLKIAYANMIGDFCLKNNMSADDILSAIACCKSVNPHYFKYGYGYGGPCLPIDTATLAKEINNDWLLKVDNENLKHLLFQIEQFEINSNKNDEHIFENVSYKKDVPIIASSQKLEMARILALKGYKIKIKDTPEVCNMIQDKYPNLFLFDK